MYLNSSKCISDFTVKYTQAYGEIKLQKIILKIKNSNGAYKLILESKKRRLAPSVGDFVSTIMQIPYFMFAKKETVAMGSLILLSNWAREYSEDIEQVAPIIIDDLSNRIIRSCCEMV